MKEAADAFRVRPTRRAIFAGAATLLSGAAARADTTFCRGESDRSALPAVRGAPLGRANPRVAWGIALSAPALYDGGLLSALEAEAPAFLAVASGCKFGNLFPDTPTGGAALPPAQWSEADDVLTLAARLRVPVRGDALVWNDALPPWISALARDKPTGWNGTLRHAFEGGIEAVFGHLNARGDIPTRWCGLVNEPFQPWSVEGERPAWRPGPWLDAFGFAADAVPAYIHRAFQLAERHRRPGTALFLNEAWCESDRFGPVLRPAVLRLVDSLHAAGRTLDAVGLEAHLMPQWMDNRTEPDWRPFAAFLRDLARRGVAIHVTELDVNDCTLRDRALRDRLVASYIESFVQTCLDEPAVASVTTWDLSDKFSWLAETTTPASTFPTLGRWAGCVADPPCPRPALYDAEMGAKPARDALMRALRGTR